MAPWSESTRRFTATGVRDADALRKALADGIRDGIARAGGGAPRRPVIRSLRPRSLLAARRPEGR